MPPRDQLRQRELGLLATGQCPGVLACDVSSQAEHAEQRAQHPFLSVGRLLPHVRQDAHTAADALVLLCVVAQRNSMPQAERARVRRALSGKDPQQTRLAGSVQPHHQQPVVALHLE